MGRVFGVTRQRIAVWHSFLLVSVLFLAGFIGVAYSYDFALEPMAVYGVSLLGMGMVNFAAGQFIRKARYTVGFLLLTLVINAHLILNTFFIRESAYILLSFAVLVVWLISLEHLSSRWQVILIVGTTVVGTAMVLADFLSPARISAIQPDWSYPAHNRSPVLHWSMRYGGFFVNIVIIHCVAS